VEVLMKVKKLLVMLLCLLFLVSVFAGCGEKSPASDSNTTNDNSDTKNGGEETPKKEPVTIVFMRTGTPEIVREIFEPMIAEFEKENSDIKVDLQDFGWADAEKKLPVMASSKTLPDIMYHLPGTVFDMATKDLILPLDEFIDDELKNDIFPGLLAAGQFDGKQYLIPCGASTLLLWYNTEIFEQAGLDPDAPPKTWEEFETYAKQIKDKTGTPGIGVYAKPGGGETSFVFESLFASAIGGNTWDSDQQEYTYYEDANKDAAVGALKLMQNLVDLSQGNVVEYGRFDGRTLMRDGKVGMALDLIHMKNQIPEQLEAGTIKVAPIPAGPSGKSISAVNVGGWYIPKNSKNPDAAWKFLRYTMKTENQIAHQKYGSVPILKSEAETYTDEFWQIVNKTVETSVAEGVCPKQTAIWQATGDQLQLLLMKKQTPEDTLNNIIKGHKEVMEK
jgi:ABC-type glycerol-3-phosphate transport system substrate-binding protein